MTRVVPEYALDSFGKWRINFDSHRFTKMSQKNYKKYLPEEIVDATADDHDNADNADDAAAENGENADNTAAE